jgi:hypothetical protein
VAERMPSQRKRRASGTGWKWGGKVQCHYWLRRTGAECRTVTVSWRHSIVAKQHTSRVKSPDTPQDVLAAGEALVEVE